MSHESALMNMNFFSSPYLQHYSRAEMFRNMYFRVKDAIITGSSFYSTQY